MSVLNNIIAPVRGLGAYTLAATEAPSLMHRNESPVDLPDDAKAEICARVSNHAWNRYPEFVPRDVLDGLGQQHGLTGDHVLLGNGSNELIQAILGASVTRGVPVYFPEPTFTLYRMMVLANDGEPRPLPLTEALEYDVEAYRRAARAEDGHLLVCAPNNPTGTIVAPAFIDELARTTSRLVILDEAYAQFGPHDLSALVARHPNLVVLRTFSKALGLAGVRLGYALAHPSLVTEFSKVKLPYNVGFFGLEVARYALRNPAVFAEIAQTLVEARERLQDALARLPFDEVLSGHANFVVVRTSRAKALFEDLRARGILVRDIGSYPRLENCLRITVGTRAENEALVSACHSFLNGEER